MVDSRASPRLASPPSVIAAEERKRHREGQGEAVGAAAPGRSNEQGSKDRAPKRPRVAKVPLAQVPCTSALLALQKRRSGGSASSSTSHSFGPASNRCGTPGCTLPDFHAGLCSTEQLFGSRHGGAVPRRLTLTLADATGVSEATPSRLGCSKCRYAAKGCAHPTCNPACPPAGKAVETEGRMTRPQARQQAKPQAKQHAKPCGTRGCTLPDHHEGLCSTERVLAP